VSSLDDPKTAPFIAGSDTSENAAVEIEPNLGALRRIVLDAITSSVDGLTDEQISATTGIVPNTARPRRIELVAKSLVVDSTRRRRVASGRNAVVWIDIARQADRSND
jgi:hypothetical protein